MVELVGCDLRDLPDEPRALFPSQSDDRENESLGRAYARGGRMAATTSSTSGCAWGDARTSTCSRLDVHTPVDEEGCT